MMLRAKSHHIWGLESTREMLLVLPKSRDAEALSLGRDAALPRSICVALHCHPLLVSKFMSVMDEEHGPMVPVIPITIISIWGCSPFS